MKIGLLFPLAFGLAMTSSAMAQQVDAPATPVNTKDAQALESVRAGIQSAADQLNAALLRGDAEGVLKWLAPEFELGRHQYRVRDREWMKRVLPLQFKRGHYTTATAKVLSVEIKEGVAHTSERIDAAWELNKEIDGGNPLSRIEGSDDQEWVETDQGWRVRRNDAIFEGLVVLAAPEAPLRPQPPIAPDSSAATIGLPVEEPKTVLERRPGSFDHVAVSLAFSPDGTQIAFDYDSQAIHLASPNSGAVARELFDKDSPSVLTYTSDGSLWTKSSERWVRRLDKETGALQKEWRVAPRNSNYGYRTSVTGDGRGFAVLEGQEVQVWSSGQVQPVTTFSVPTEEVRNIECSPDSQLLALVTWDITEVRRAMDGTLLYTIKGENWGGFLADGQTLATTKLDTSYHLRAVRPQEEGEEKIVFRSSKTGKVEREVPTPSVWSGKQQKEREQLDAGQSVFSTDYFSLPAPVVSPDGSVAASVYSDGSIGLWDTGTRQFIQVLRGFSRLHSDGNPKIVFSPDGKQLAESSGEGEIGLWDLKAPVN